MARAHALLGLVCSGIWVEENRSEADPGQCLRRKLRQGAKLAESDTSMLKLEWVTRGAC